MRRVIATIAAVSALVCVTSAQDFKARAIALHKQTPLIDGHNDYPWALRDIDPGRDLSKADIAEPVPKLMTDIPRLRAGHVGAQFWSVWIPVETKGPAAVRTALEQIDVTKALVARYPQALEMAGTAADIRRIHKSGKVASLIGVEGGHMLDDSLAMLRQYYDLGVRYLTLTHTKNTAWADSATDAPTHKGLTAFGKEVVREMNRLGMLVDLSHVSPGTMSDALDVTEAPVIFSHSGSRELVDHKRNIPDSILARLPKNGGVVMVPFVTSFVSKEVKAWGDAQGQAQEEARRRLGTDTAAVRRAVDDWNKANPQPKATLAQVADHIEHVRKIAGVDHVGIGSDFDGITDLVVGLEDVSKFPDLFAELSRRGWTDTDLRKLAGDNVLRALKQAEAVSARLKKQRPPSTKTIQQMDGKVAQ